MAATRHHPRTVLLAPALLLAACATPLPPPAPGAVAGTPAAACACARLEGALAGPAAPGASRLLPHVEAGLSRALAHQGCSTRASTPAPWRLHYELRLQEREQVLDEGGALLEPRLVCELSGCRVRHDWIHQGPPGRSPPRRVTRDAELRLQLHADDDPRPAWRGSTTRVLPASGGRAADAVARAARDLAALLPRLQRADCARP